MGWIKWTGKTLEFVGKLAQAESFERWADSQGEKIVQRVGLGRRICFWSGQEQQGKESDMERTGIGFRKKSGT